MSLDACSCDIDDYEKLAPDSSKSYTIYKVRVQRRQTAVSPGNPEFYVVNKRFSEFKALRQELLDNGAEPLRKVGFPSRKIKNTNKVRRVPAGCPVRWIDLSQPLVLSPFLLECTVTTPARCPRHRGLAVLGRWAKALPARLPGVYRCHRRWHTAARDTLTSPSAERRSPLRI